LFAPVYLRLLLGHEPLSDELAATLVRQLLAGLRNRDPQRTGACPPRTAG
jgi:hypothetical protein